MRFIATFVTVALVLGTASAVHADCRPTPGHKCPWYTSRHRVVHVSITTSAGALDIGWGLWIQPRLARTMCDWCQPTSLDVATRDALKWSDTKAAATASNVVGVAVLPTLTVGLVLAGTFFSHGEDPNYPYTNTARVLDDLVPVGESVAVGQLVTQFFKVGLSRQRPYAHFGAAQGLDDNLSFLSGHTSLAFSLVVSAGSVAHRRGYNSELYIWSIGLPLAAATGYLRIAADKHYVTDVLAGAALGTGVGLAVSHLAMGPLPHGPTIVPTDRGVAVVGMW